MRYIYLFLGLVVSQNIKPNYQGGCALVNDSIYYFGGSISQSLESFSDSVYKWSLKDGIKLDDEGVGEWKEVAKLEKNDIITLPAISTNPSVPNSIYLFGSSDGGEKIQNFRKFNIDSNTWAPLKDIFTKIPEANFSSVPTKDYIILSSKMVAYEDMLISVGGQIIRSDRGAFFTNGLFVYSTKDKSGSFVSTDYDVDKHTSFVYKDKIYSFGGYSNIKTKPNSAVYIVIYDLKKNKWGLAYGANEKLDSVYGINPSTVIVGNTMYVIPGPKSYEDTSVRDSFIYSVDLDTLEFKLVKIEGFKPADMGCLVHYDGKLILSFGRIGAELTSKSQLIDIKDFKLVSNTITNPDIPSSNNNIANGLKASSPNQGAIIGGSISGALFLIIVICALFWYRNKRNKELKKSDNNDIYFAAKPLSVHLWSDANLKLDNNEPTFSLQSTQTPSMFDSVTLPTGYSAK